jgi:hypothetical protein
MRHPCCLSANLSLLTSECLNQSLWNLVHHGTWAHLNSVLHKSLSSVYMSVCVSRISLLGNTFPWQQIHATIKEMLELSFSILSVSYQMKVCGSVCVIPLSLLGNGMISTFTWQRRIVGSVVFYEGRVVLRGIRGKMNSLAVNRRSQRNFDFDCFSQNFLFYWIPSIHNFKKSA